MGEQDRLDEEQEDDNSSEIIDGRLSAIMPRKLFQDDAAVKSGLLQVYVRMKPEPASTETCMVLDNSHLLKATWRNKEAVYKFSKVFQQDADQAEVYNGTTASLVEDFVDLRQPSAVVMAYGVTSAGKTFTMQGSSDQPGLVPLALKDIFQTINSNGGSNTYRLSLSVCEIYNESIHDLLAPANMRAKPAALRLKEDKAGHISVVGVTEVPVGSDREALELLRRAAKARQCAGTAVNERSSRSHAVITVKLQSTSGGSSASSVAGCFGSVLPSLQESYLHFVDLAGCERVKRTGNSGARLRESVAINSSLMTLARCLEVLRYNQQHPGDQKVIPYRESKITHLFKQVLHGNGRFVMVVNVSPACEAFNETKRVLQYAALASKVTMTSEIEQDLAGAGPPHLLPPEADSAAAMHSAAAAEASVAAAAASAAALSAAQARIEELLDDKADLEYEIDVVERKVELLREELIKSEVEKEQLEADIRGEVQEEMQQLLDAALAKERARAANAEEEAATLRQKVHQLEQQLEEQRQLHTADNKQIKALQAAADHASNRSMLPISEHKRLLQEVKEAAASAAMEVEAAHIAQDAILVKKHQEQLLKLQQELAAARENVQTLQQQQQQQLQQQAGVAESQQQAAAAVQQLAALHNVAAEALQVLEQSMGSQQQSIAGAHDLCSSLQHLQASLAAQQQQQQQQPPAGTEAAERLAVVHGLAAEALQLLEQAAVCQQQGIAAMVVAELDHGTVVQQRQASLAAGQEHLQQQQQVLADSAVAVGGNDSAGVTDSASQQQHQQQLAAQQPESAATSADTVPVSKDMQQQQQQQQPHGAQRQPCKASRSRRTTLAGSTAAMHETGVGRRSRRTTLSRCLPSLPEELVLCQAVRGEEEARATAAVTTVTTGGEEETRGAVAGAAASAEVGASAAEAANAPAASAVVVTGAAKRRRRTMAAAAAAAPADALAATGRQVTADAAGVPEPTAADGAKIRSSSSSRHKAMHWPETANATEDATAAASGSGGGLQQPTLLGVIAEEEEEQQKLCGAGNDEADGQGEIQEQQLAGPAAGAGTDANPDGHQVGAGVAAAAAALPLQPAVSRKRRRGVIGEEGEQQQPQHHHQQPQQQQQQQQQANPEKATTSSQQQQVHQPAAGVTGCEEQQGKRKRQRQDCNTAQQQLEQQVHGSGPVTSEGAAAAAADASAKPHEAPESYTQDGVSAAFVPGVAAAGAVRRARGGGRAAVSSKLPGKRKRRASVDGSSAHQEQQQQQQQLDAEEQDILAGQGGGGSRPLEPQQQQSIGGATALATAAAEAAGEQGKAARKPAAAGKKARGKGWELDQEEQWRPADQVLQDVTQHQLGVAVGRRATIAAMGGGSGAAGVRRAAAAAAAAAKPSRAAAGAGGDGDVAGAGQQHAQLPHIAGGITPVAFRTRHRRVV